MDLKQIFSLLIVKGHVNGHLDGYDPIVHHDRDEAESFERANCAFSCRVLHGLLVIRRKHVERMRSIQEVHRHEVSGDKCMYKRRREY